AVAQVRRNNEGALAADMHGSDAFIPALDDLALADREGEGLVPVERAVELLALLAVLVEPSGVIDGDGLAGARDGSSTDLDVDHAQAARGGHLVCRLGCLCSQRHRDRSEEDCGHDDMLKGHDTSQSYRSKLNGRRWPTPMASENSILAPPAGEPGL